MAEAAAVPCPTLAAAGNDLSRSFNWGPAFTHSWIKGRKATYKTLNRVGTVRTPSARQSHMPSDCRPCRKPSAQPCTPGPLRLT